MLAALLTGACALAGCGGGDGAAPEESRQAGGEILAITTPTDGSTTSLRRLDRDTLSPRGDALDLGEYHDAWAFSPDGRTLAVGTFARTGVRFVDPDRLRIVRDVPMPIAAMGVGWVSPDRVAVLLQRGGVVVVDARDGSIERRFPMRYRPPCERRRQATTPHGVLFVVVTRRGAVRLVRVDASSGLRVVALRGVRARSGLHSCGSAAFAVDPSGERAVVAGPRGPVADVRIGSLAVRYRSVRALQPAAACSSRRRLCTGRRTAVWPAAGALAIAGANWIDRRGARPAERPAGVAVVDPATWRARAVDSSAADMASGSDGTLLSFGGDRAGLRATAFDGTLRWSAAKDTGVRGAAVAGGRVYVLGDEPGSVRVLDAATGRALGSSESPLGRFDVLTGRAEAGGSPLG